MTTAPPTEVLAFAVVPADTDVDDIDFFGVPVELYPAGDVAFAAVESQGPPAAAASVVQAYDSVVRALAERAPVLPLRFGTIALDRDLVAQAEMQIDGIHAALDLVRDRQEYVARIRPRVDDVVAALDEQSRRNLQAIDVALDRGAEVHRIMVGTAANVGALLRERCSDDGAVAALRIHDDQLGADVEFLLDADTDAVSFVKDRTEDIRLHCDVDVIGPDPGYRYAGRLNVEFGQVGREGRR